MTSGGTWITAVGTLVAAGVSVGVLSDRQATVVNWVASVLVTLCPLVTSVLVQWHVLRTAEPLVTPLSDPQDADGQPLVRPLAAPPK
jgi:hypothetical protein